MRSTRARIVTEVIRVAANPDLLARAVLSRWPRASFVKRLEYDALPRPHYAYGVFHAAMEAKALGIERISAIEFGVAAGAGLAVLEQVAEQVEKETGVAVATYGFETTGGMPPPTDHRDMPYVWRRGLFRPRGDIRLRVPRSKLVMGDVRETVAGFCASHNPPPLGFVAQDMDYYSSTAAALRLFDEAHQFLLPRVFCYFDDCIGDDHELHSEFTGELAAVRQFNDSHEHRKLAPIFGLRHKRRIPAPWNDVMFVAHIFDHPRYNEYTNPRWKPLRQGMAAGMTADGHGVVVAAEKAKQSC